MLALLLTTLLQTQADLPTQVATCMRESAYSCSDMKALENDDLVACFMRIPYDSSEIRAEFLKNARIVCPLDPSIRKVSHSWNY
jgi:hypothetical protein